MDYVANMVRFPMPTHPHIFGNLSNGYRHLKTATCGVQRIARNWISQHSLNFDTVMDNSEIMAF
jgi:hypothetical protein